MNIYAPFQFSYKMANNILGIKYVAPLALAGIGSIAFLIYTSDGNKLNGIESLITQEKAPIVASPPSDSLDNEIVSDNISVTPSLDTLTSKSSIEPHQPTPKPLYLIKEEYYDVGRYGSNTQVKELTITISNEGQNISKRNELSDLAYQLVLGIANDDYNLDKILEFRIEIMERKGIQLTPKLRERLIIEINEDIQVTVNNGLKEGWARYWGNEILDSCCHPNN